MKKIPLYGEKMKPQAIGNGYVYSLYYSTAVNKEDFTKSRNRQVLYKAKGESGEYE
jgi:hypothetical protein